jgi:hypothetical protein
MSIIGAITQGLDSLNKISEGLASVGNIQQNISNAVQQVGTFVSDLDLTTITDTIAQTRFPSNFPVPDIAGNSDIGFGSTQSAGGAGNSGNFLKYSLTANPDPSVSSAGLEPGFESINLVLKNALNQNWQTRNSEPGNPLIIEAYRISGREYKKDGRTGEYSWHAAFVNWALSKAGIQPLQTMSAFPYARYGTAVEFTNPRNLRKNDIIIFKSIVGLAHIGFVQDYDPQTRTIGIIGGNQAGRVKLTRFPFSTSNPQLYITNVRRRWTVPAEFDTPLFVDGGVRDPVTGLVNQGAQSYSNTGAATSARCVVENSQNLGTTTGPRTAPSQTTGAVGSPTRPIRPGQQTSGPALPGRQFGTFAADGTLGGSGRAARPNAAPIRASSNTTPVGPQ